MGSRREQIVEAIAEYGLRQHPTQLSSGELAQMEKDVTIILSKQKGVPTIDLVHAIRFGMNKVWPVTENGYFDSRDVIKHITKAKAMARQMKNRGQIPVTGAEARASFKRMVEEYTADE